MVYWFILTLSVEFEDQSQTSKFMMKIAPFSAMGFHYNVMHFLLFVEFFVLK